MTDQTRADFEAHFKLTIRQKWQHPDGSYKFPEIQAKWEGYQAGLAAAPTQEPAAWICIYDDGEVDYTPLRELAEAAPTAIPLYRSAAAAPGAVQEPVEYQVRTRPMWRDEAEGWTEWRKCSPESYADYVRVPVLHDWQHETRALYAAPVAAAAPTNDRAAFEAHFGLNSRQAWQDNAGDYKNPDVQKWWEGWKAAKQLT
jgi:hypothetical protein